MSSLVFDLSLTNKDDLNRNYTYKDLETDVVIEQSKKDIRASLDYLAINNGIYNLFLFAQGERILIPEFGNSIYKYLYEPITDLTSQKITNEIIEMFKKWEPRVHVEKLSINADPDQNTYYIVLMYSVPSLDRQKILNFNVAIDARRT